MKKISTLIILLFIITIANAQNLTTVSPNDGLPLEPLSITISGQNTYFTQATYTAVWFSQGSETYQMPQSFDIINDNEIRVNITFPANYNTPELYDVNVYDANNGLLTLYDAFTLLFIDEPYISDITPNQAERFETLDVTITGENTHFAQATQTAVWFSQGSRTVVYPNSMNIISETEIEANFSFPYNVELGDYDVNVVNELDVAMEIFDAFTIIEELFSPEINYIEPENVVAQDTFTIRISTDYTDFSQGNETTVWLQSATNKEIIVANTINLIDDYTIDAYFDLPSNIENQMFDIHVFNDFYGEIVLEDAFTLGPILIEENNITLKISPNPTKDIVNIKSSESISNISVFDLNGKHVLSNQFSSNEIKLDLSKLSSGVYFLNIDLKNNQTIKRPIIIE